MKNKKLMIGVSSTLVFGLIFSTGLILIKKVPSKKVSASEPKVITVDANHCWGDGQNNYKVAARFTDGENYEWSSLVSVEAPNTFITIPYEISLTPTHVAFYTYSESLEETAWEDDKETPATNVHFNSTFSYETNNYILDNDNYALATIPSMVHQVLLPEQAFSSVEVYMTHVAANELQHAEYSAQEEMKAGDLMAFSGFLVNNLSEEDILFADNMNPGDLILDTEDGGCLDCGVDGTYNFYFDYTAKKLKITKEVEPTPVDPEDPTDPVDPSGGDTPLEDPSEKGEGESTSLKISIKDILKIIAKTFRDAWNDLVAHIKRWFKLN